ncbi:trafficking protein particle complex subunit 9-like [Sycon ciliatum]|uniref:trafficking protein particle complex subunit 9-like n=1 Tax=Sycon ciliatum TaxID=27933 RepID=UPI0031F61DE9
MRVDFSQNTTDHGKVNVLLCPVGEQLSENFLAWIEQSIVNVIKTNFSPSRYRSSALRVLRSAPKQSDELWGEFLYHRRLHGVIGISNCTNIDLVERAADVFTALAASYPRALHSCLIVTAPNATELVQSIKALNPTNLPNIAAIDVETEVWANGAVEGSDLDGMRFQQFLDSFANTMRDKLLDACKEHGDCRSEGVLLRAPPENHGATVDDTRSANRKKRCMGRLMKQKGDLLMLAGETVAAIAWYAEAYEVLKGINDSLWIGGALLGYSCALHRLRQQADYLEARGEVLSSKMDGPAVPSFQEGSPTFKSEDRLRLSPSPSPVTSEPRLKTFSPISSPVLGHKEGIGRGSDTSAGINSSLLRSTSGSSVIVCGVPVRTIMISDNWARRKSAVTVDGGVREAIAQFSRVEGAMLFEAECSMLLVRLLMELKKNVEAAALLSETMSVDYTLDFSEKLVLLITAGKLFRTMGFERKAAFAFRLGALQRVRSSRPSVTAWKEAYMLLSNCLEGFGLDNSLPRFLNGHHFGWHRLQCCILRELSFLAHRSGNGVLAISHSLVLLHAHHMHMAEKEIAELIKQLNELTHAIRSLHQQMRLEVLPEWMLNKLPKVTSFRPVSLPQHLLPLPIEEKAQSGPFIFSSLRQTGEPSQEEQVVWVQGSSAEVSVELTNPLSCEIRIEKMALLTEGAAFEAVPTSISLAPNNEPYSCVLIGIPKAVGQVTLLGYVAHFYEVEHTVRVAITKGISKNIRVVPQLPFLTVRNLLDSPDVPRRSSSFTVPTSGSNHALQCSNSLSRVSNLLSGTGSSSSPSVSRSTSVASTSGTALGRVSPPYVCGSTVLRRQKGGAKHSVYSVELNLHPGQSSCVSLMLANRGDRPVTSVKFLCEEKPQQPEGSPFALTWSEDIVAATLPIGPDSSLVVPVTVQLHKWHQQLAATQSGTGGLLICQCQVMYTGDEGREAGLQRSCRVEFRIRILPILELYDLDAQSNLNSPELFNLSFMAMNCSETQINLSTSWEGEKIEGASTSEAVDIAPLSSARVTLSIPRLHLQTQTATVSTLMSAKESQSLAERYMEYFSSNIAIEWLNVMEAGGSFHFSGRRLQARSHLLHNFLPETLVYAITVNGSAEHRLDDLPLMAPVPVIVRVTNKSADSVGPMLMQLRLHEALGNGYIDTELSGKCAVTGCTTMPVTKLQSMESCEFTSEIVLFAPGKYTMYVRTVKVELIPQQQSTNGSMSPTKSATGAFSSSHSITLCPAQIS